MNFEEEMQTQEDLSKEIDQLGNQIQSFLYEKDEFMLRRKRAQISAVQCGMVFRELESKKHDLIREISNYAFRVKDLKDSYDETLTSLHFIQYQMYERMEILKVLLATAQTDGMTIESIFSHMDKEFKTREKWLKEIPSEFREKLDSLKEDEEKAKNYIITSASDLSNALLKASLRNPLNKAVWKDLSFENYPSLKEAIRKTKELQDSIVNLQIALCMLRNQL